MTRRLAVAVFWAVVANPGVWAIAYLTFAH